MAPALLGGMTACSAFVKNHRQIPAVVEGVVLPVEAFGGSIDFEAGGADTPHLRLEGTGRYSRPTSACPRSLKVSGCLYLRRLA